MRSLLATCAVLAALLALLTFMGARPHETGGLADEYREAMGPAWASRIILDANSTTGYFVTTAGGSVEVVFPWDTAVRVEVLGETTCCFVMDQDSTIGDQTTTSAVVVTDPGTDANGIARRDGQGACITLYTSATIVPQYRSLQGGVGFRERVCSALAPGIPGSGQPSPVRPPCDSDGDCTAAGAPSGTTCLTSPTVTQALEGGAYLGCRAVAASTDATATIVR